MMHNGGYLEEIMGEKDADGKPMKREPTNLRVALERAIGQRAWRELHRDVIQSIEGEGGQQRG
jgi:hypothetical protein